MEEVFEPVTAKQKDATENQEENHQFSEKQLQALHDSAKGRTQAIHLQTKAN